MYVYIMSESFMDLDQVRRELFTVGFYRPDGQWESESDHDSREKAGARAHYLNGGTGPQVIEETAGDYVPPATFEACIESGIEAVQEVVDNWESGDLAGAVNGAEDWATQAGDLLPDKEEKS